MAWQPQRELHVLAARIGYAARKAQRALAARQPPVVFAQTDAALSAIGRALAGHPENPDTVMVSVPRAVAPRIPPIAEGLDLHRTLEFENGRHDHNMGLALARARAKRHPTPEVVHCWREVKTQRDHATHWPFKAERRPEAQDAWAPYSSPARFRPWLARELENATHAHKHQGGELPLMPEGVLSVDLEAALRAATSHHNDVDAHAAAQGLRVEALPFYPTTSQPAAVVASTDAVTTYEELAHASFKIPQVFNSLVVHTSAIRFLEVPRIQCVVVQDNAISAIHNGGRQTHSEAATMTDADVEHDQGQQNSGDLSRVPDCCNYRSLAKGNSIEETVYSAMVTAVDNGERTLDDVLGAGLEAVEGYVDSLVAISRPLAQQLLERVTGVDFVKDMPTKSDSHMTDNEFREVLQSLPPILAGIGAYRIVFRKRVRALAEHGESERTFSFTAMPGSVGLEYVRRTGVVVTIFANGQAHEHGVRVGDRITRVAGCPYTDITVVECAARRRPFQLGFSRRRVHFLEDGAPLRRGLISDVLSPCFSLPAPVPTWEELCATKPEDSCKQQ